LEFGDYLVIVSMLGAWFLVIRQSSFVNRKSPPPASRLFRNSSAHRKDAKNAKKKLLKNEKKIQEYVRTRLPARLRRSDGYLFGQVAILPFKTTRISGSFSKFHHLLLKNNNFASFAVNYYQS